MVLVKSKNHGNQTLENLIENVEESIGPIGVAVFNLGSQIGNRSLFETSDKVFELSLIHI